MLYKKKIKIIFYHTKTYKRWLTINVNFLKTGWDLYSRLKFLNVQKSNEQFS